MLRPANSKGCIVDFCRYGLIPRTQAGKPEKAKIWCFCCWSVDTPVELQPITFSELQKLTLQGELKPQNPLFQQVLVGERNNMLDFMCFLG